MFFKHLQNNFIAEHHRLILWIPVFFALGIGIYFSLPFELSFLWLCPCFIFLLLALFLFRKHQFIFMGFLCLFFVLLGFSDIKFQTYFHLSNLSFPTSEQTTYLKGQLFKTDFNTKGKTRLWLKDVQTFDSHLKGIYRITLNSKNDFPSGSCVETVATIMPPSPPLVPNGYQFDRHAFFENISAIGYTESEVYPIDCETNPALYEKTETFITHLRDKISHNILESLPFDEASVISALSIGNKNLISNALYTQYRNAGLAHFLSISGLHMGIIAAFVFFFVRFLIALCPFLALNYSSKKIASILAVLFCFIYLLLSGMAVPATRAFIMCSLVFLGIFLDREAISMRVASFAAFLILFLEPYLLLSPSFELSFAAVVALISFYEAAAQKLFLKGKQSLSSRLLFYFVSVLLTTLIASLATIPFCLYHFSTFTPYALFGNLLSAPIISFLIMPFIFLGLVFMPLHLHFLFLKIAGFGVYLLNNITHFISHFSFSSIHIFPIPLSGLILITFGGLWLCLWQRKWRYWGIILIVLGFLSFSFVSLPDILYSSDAQTIGLKTHQNGLVIFSSKKNNFLNQTWSENYTSSVFYKKLQSIDDINLQCTLKECTYRDIFTFDLNGHLSLNGKSLETQDDLGGAIYLHDSPKIQPIRQTIGHRPWNSADR